MKRMMTLITAAGAAGLLLASTAARADEYRDRDDHYGERYRGYDEGRREFRAREWREHEWRELQEARRAFYARWDGNPWRRARFERWYAQRCAELRERG